MNFALECLIFHSRLTTFEFLNRLLHSCRSFSCLFGGRCFLLRACIPYRRIMTLIKLRCTFDWRFFLIFSNRLILSCSTSSFSRLSWWLKCLGWLVLSGRDILFQRLRRDLIRNRLVLIHHLLLGIRWQGSSLNLQPIHRLHASIH